MTPDYFPRDQFYCLLDEQPDYLVPARLFRQRKGTGALMINPHCWFAWRGSPPPDMALRMGSLGGLFRFPWTIWVDDPATDSLMPFWLGPELAHLLKDMVPGQVVRTPPRKEVLDLLWNAQIVVAADHVNRRRQEWAERAHCYSTFLTQGYVALDDLLHPFCIGALRRYFRYQTRSQRFKLGDGQVSGRYFAHSQPVADFFHRQLSSLVSNVAGVLVEPSYSYVSLYQGGASLAPHTDREACEYTLSLCFDATPEPEAQVPWPLHLGTTQGHLKVLQHLGDGLLFRGRYLPHWRETLPAGNTVSCLLFHYTDRKAG